MSAGHLKNRVLHSLFPAGPISLSHFFQLPPVEQRGPARWRLPHLPGSGDGAAPTVQRDELFPSGAITRCRRQRCCCSSASIGLGRKMIAKQGWFECLWTQQGGFVLVRVDLRMRSLCPAELWRGFGRGLQWFEALFSVPTHHAAGKPATQLVIPTAQLAEKELGDQVIKGHKAVWPLKDYQSVELSHLFTTLEKTVHWAHTQNHFRTYNPGGVPHLQICHLIHPKNAWKRKKPCCWPQLSSVQACIHRIVCCKRGIISDVFMTLNNARVTADVCLRPSEASVTPGRWWRSSFSNRPFV